MKNKYLHPVLHVFPQGYGDFKLVILQKFCPGKKEGLKIGRRKETGKAPLGKTSAHRSFFQKIQIGICHIFLHRQATSLMKPPSFFFSIRRSQGR
jgi:hypothetical protein